jgi:hypothetical protein
MSWTTIRTGVATLIDAIAGVEPRAAVSLGKSDSVTATVIPGDPVIEPTAHGAKYNVRFIVRVRVQKAKLTESQETMDVLIWPTGAGSLIAAIYSDPTIAAALDGVRLVQVVNYEQPADSNEVRADLEFIGIATA